MRICTGPRRFKARHPLPVSYKLIRHHRRLVRSVRGTLAVPVLRASLLATDYSIWRFYATLWRHMHPSHHTPIFLSGRSGYGQLRHTTHWMRTDGWFLRKARPFPVHKQRRLS